MFDNGCMLTEIVECLCFFVTTAGSEKGEQVSTELVMTYQVLKTKYTASNLCR